MIARIGNVFSRLSERFMPDPFVFAILLTIVAFLLGVIFTDNSPFQMIGHWNDGFWDLLVLGMQISFILVTGAAITMAPVVKRGLEKVASLPKNAAQATALTVLVACILSWINFALGMIGGAFFALFVGRAAYKKGMKVNYPLLVAAAYSGQMVWHLGFSSSAALASATVGHINEELVGIIPISDTIISNYSLLLSAILILITIPLIFYFMTPKKESELKGIEEYAPDKLNDEEDQAAATLAEENDKKKTFANMADNSKIIVGIVAIMGLIVIVNHFYSNGFDLSMNMVAFILLIGGLILHRTPAAYSKAIGDSIGSVAGVILQYPFYAGIAGMVILSGLGLTIVDIMTTFTTEKTFPIATWLFAGIVNVFVPSGGGQWGLMSPVLVPAAQDLGVPIGKLITAFAAGENWTNMIQPFWAIAMLGICGVKARDVMGYCAVLAILTIPVYIVALTFLPY